MTDPTSPKDLLKVVPAQPIQLTFDEWAAKFKPVKNHLNPGRGYDDTLFETYDEDLKYVVDKTCEQNGNAYVWTLVDDGETEAITDGYHYINRMGYFITEVPCDEHSYEIVLWSSEDEDENNADENPVELG